MATVPPKALGALARPGPVSHPRAANRPALDPALLLRVLQRRWKVLAAGLLLTLLATAAAVKFLAVRSWESTTTLIYTPLPIPDVAKSLYTQPDLKTLAGLADSDEMMENLRSQFEIKLPLKLVKKALTVTVPSGTKILQLAFSWDSGENSAKMLNALTENFVQDVTRIRRSKLSEHMEDFKTQLSEVQAREQQAVDDLRKFHQLHGLTDYKDELNRTNLRIVELQGQLSSEERRSSDLAAQLVRIDQQLDLVKKEQETATEEEAALDAATSTVNENRMRQGRLKEMITEERVIMETEAQLVAKRNELARAQALLSKQLIPVTQVEAIKAEIGVLRAQIDKNQRIQKYQEELEKLDKDVLLGNKKKKGGVTPIIVQVLFRRLELELDQISNQKEMDQIKLHIAEARDKIAKLDSLNGDYQALAKKNEAIASERIQLEQLLAGMRNLISLNTGEFVVAAPARPAPYPSASNVKLLIAATGGLGMLLTLGLAGAAETLAHRRGCESRGNRLGEPMLAQITAHSGIERHRALRALALRLRQHLHQSGDVAVFAATTDEGHADLVLDELAHLLALRDERVLLIDARLDRVGLEKAAGPTVVTNSDPSNPEVLAVCQRFVAPGLTDYLSFTVQELDDLCTQTDNPSIDRLGVGTVPVSAEVFATHRMTELLHDLRQRYSLVLIHGPSLHHTVDLQILGALAHGVITINDGHSQDHTQTRQTLRELREIQAPLLGQVLVRFDSYK